MVCARHHPSAPNEPATALQRTRPTRVGSYLRDTPELRHLKHEVDQDLAPVTTPAAAALPRLVMNVPQSVTLLVGITLRAHIVCLRLPPEHSFRWAQALTSEPRDFFRPKLEAPDYPSMCGFRDSAPSPIEVTGKPLRAFRG